MRTQSLLTLLGFATTFSLSLDAQSMANARAALFAGDLETAQSELATQPATAELQLLKSIIDIGNWIEQDLTTFAASVGADATAVSDYADLSNYFESDPLAINPQPIYGSNEDGAYWRYDWVRDPANDLLGFELIESTGRSWNEDGVMSYWDVDSSAEAYQNLDYWLSANDIHQGWSPAGHLISINFLAANARQVDLTVFKDMAQDAGFGGTLFLNGIEIGDFKSNGWFSFEASGVDASSVYNPGSSHSPNLLYTLSLWLEPGDQLTLQVEPTWYMTSNESGPFLGFNLDDPTDFEVSNGIGYMNIYPKLTPGTTSELFSRFLFRQSAPTSQLLTSLISRLSSLQGDFSVTFDPEETGLTERIRLEYEDTQILLAFLKFIQGIQLVTDMYSTGSIDATYATYLDYLEDPAALWDDYPQILALVQGRSAQGAQAKLLFEQAVNHYTAVESALWSRSSGATESYLFEVGEATQEERSDFSNSLSQFVESLNGSVALADFDPSLSAAQSLSLQPFVADSPVNLRDVIPQFGEQGVFAASSGNLLAAGFSAGISNLEWDKLLADANALYIPSPESLVGKVLLKKSAWSYPPEYEVYFFNSASHLTFADSEESGVHAYTWDSATAIINDLTWSEQIELEFETGVTGAYLSFSDEQWWGEPGSFILYDGTWDLDGNGQEDAKQIAAGNTLQFFDDPFAIFYDDWDGDGLYDDEEPPLNANPQLYDTDSDGDGDWEEVNLYGTDPGDANSLRSWPVDFSPSDYLNLNPDVAAAFGSDYNAAWAHYLNYGVDEGRSHSDRFSIDDYLSLNPDVAAAFGSDKGAALEHWFNYGKAEGRLGYQSWPSSFVPSEYLAFNGDLAAAFGADSNAVWAHYLNYGVYEGRKHSETFQIDDYLNLNPDLAAAFGSDKGAALEHWFNYGKAEGRLGYQSWPSTFVPSQYLAFNGDVAAAFGSDYNAVWAQYVDYGVYEGRRHSETFQIDDYLALNQDVADAFGSDKGAALEHWFNYGKAEGRLGYQSWPSTFVPSEYLERNGDVAAAFGADYNAAWSHYLNYGVNEGRSHSDSFSIDDYLSLNPDVAAAFGSDKGAALEHWFNYGINEGRSAFIP